MIRTLIMISVAGFVLCIGCIGAAFAIAGGPFWIQDWSVVRGDSAWRDHDRHRFHHHGHHDDMDMSLGNDDGASATRDLTWSGGDRLSVDVPADIVFTQGPTAKVSVAGPADAVNRVRIRDGHIRFDDDESFDGRRLKIIMTAPAVRRFDLSGSQNLVIEGFRQDRLQLDITGAAHVSAKGQVKTVDLDIAGSGDADLAELVVDDAQIDISGSGHAKLGPKGVVKADISGDGEVELTRKPAKLSTDISGSGRVSQPGLPG